MSSKIDRRLLDTNAAAMGGGVGLAVLESMFSLVQSQSVMNAAMVRDYQLSHPLVMDSLAVALNEILYPFGDPYDDYDDDGVVVPIRRSGGKKARRPVSMKMRRRPSGPQEPPIPVGGDEDDDGGPGGSGGGAPQATSPPPDNNAPKFQNFMQMPTPETPGGGGEEPEGGAVDLTELTGVLREIVEEIKAANAAPREGPEHTTTTTTKTSEHVESAAQLDALLSVVNMVGKQMESMIDVNKSALTAPMLMVT